MVLLTPFLEADDRIRHPYSRPVTMAMHAARRRLPFHHEHPVMIVPLTIAVWREDDHWLSECVELGIGTFGESPDDAAAQAMDAVCSYLNTLEEIGERARIFSEKSIATYLAEAPQEYHLAAMTRELAHREALQLRPFEYSAQA